jgi:hypothetical protein
LSRARYGGKALPMDEERKPTRPKTRHERLAAKLRENLRRRKAQTRELEGRSLPKAPGDS